MAGKIGDLRILQVANWGAGHGVHCGTRFRAGNLGEFGFLQAGKDRAAQPAGARGAVAQAAGVSFWSAVGEVAWVVWAAVDAGAGKIISIRSVKFCACATLQGSTIFEKVGSAAD